MSGGESRDPSHAGGRSGRSQERREGTRRRGQRGSPVAFIPRSLYSLLHFSSLF